MKLVKTLGILLCCALLASTAVATPSKNSEMPTEKEVTAFIDNFKASGDFANSAYDAFIEQYPAGHCDFSVCSYMVGLLVSRGWENMTYEELEEYLKCREQEERHAAIMWSTGGNQHLAACKGGKRL